MQGAPASHQTGPVFPGCHLHHCYTSISHGTVSAMQFLDYQATC